MVGTRQAQLGAVPPAGNGLQVAASNRPRFRWLPCALAVSAAPCGHTVGAVGGWPCPSCGPQAGRVWRSAAGSAPPLPATYSRCSSPGAKLAIGMWALLPKETVAFLGFLSPARAQKEPLGDTLRDCLSFRASTLPMPFLVSLQNHQMLEGVRVPVGPWGRAGQAPAWHCTAVPCRGERCLFHGRSN